MNNEPEERDTREGRRTPEVPAFVTRTFDRRRKKLSDEEVAAAPDFDGGTYNEKKDKKRLATLLMLVQRFMSDGLPHTLEEIHLGIAKGSEAGISARLRDLRKKKFGGKTVIRRRRGDPRKGLWEYILVQATAETEHGEKWEGV